MASLITCRVHPVVLLTIIDAYERRPPETKEAAVNKVIGTLLGTFEKGVVEVTNCYPVPHSEANEEAKLQTQFNKEMFDLFKKSNASELPVGWFSTHPDVNELSNVYHSYYQKFVSTYLQTREQMPIVLLTVDTTLHNHRMGLKAYIRTHAGLPKLEREQCTIFMPIEVEVISTEPEQIGVDVIFAGTLNPKRVVELFGGVKQISNVTDQMLSWLDHIKKYVDSILSGKQQPDASVGRKLMELVNSVSQVQPSQFEDMLNSSMKDYLMVVYLAQLAKTQLYLHERLISL